MAEGEKIVKRIKLVKSSRKTELLQFITKQNNKLTSAKHKQNQLELTMDTMGKKMVLKARKAVSNLGYYVGVMDGNSITIAPTKVYQLQPDLHFMEEEINYQQEAKTIHLQTQQDISKSALLQKSEKEPWVALSVHLSDSEKSEDLRRHFHEIPAVKNELDSVEEFDENSMDVDSKDITPKDYLHLISQYLSTLKPFSPQLSLSETKHLNLHDRLLALMLNCHAISHSDLKDLLKDTNSDKEILEAMVVIGVNIKGVWIIKSEYLYTSRPKQARDLLLLTLLNDGALDRLVWTNVTGMDAATSLNMLREICVLEEKKWKIKVAEKDPALFAKKYHNVVESTAEFIKIEGNMAFEAITMPKKSINVASTKTKPSVKLLPTATKSSDSLIKLEGEDFESQFPNLIKTIFHQSGGLLRREILIRTINFQKSQKECLFKEMDTSAIKLELEKHTISLRPDLVIAKDPPDISLVDFRNVLIRIFAATDKIKKKEVMEKWQEACDCVPSPAQYTKCMQEFAATKSGGIWILKGLKD